MSYGRQRGQDVSKVYGQTTHVFVIIFTRQQRAHSTNTCNYFVLIDKSVLVYEEKTNKDSI